MKGTITKTTQTFIKMLTLGVNTILYHFNSKIGIFVKVGLFQLWYP